MIGEPCWQTGALLKPAFSWRLDGFEHFKRLGAERILWLSMICFATGCLESSLNARLSSISGFTSRIRSQSYDVNLNFVSTEYCTLTIPNSYNAFSQV